MRITVRSQVSGQRLTYLYDVCHGVQVGSGLAHCGVEDQHSLSLLRHQVQHT